MHMTLTTLPTEHNTSSQLAEIAEVLVAKYLVKFEICNLTSVSYAINMLCNFVAPCQHVMQMNLWT